MIRWDDLRRLRIIFIRFVRPHLGLIVLASYLGILVAALNTLQLLVLAPIVDVATARAPGAAGAWRAITLNNVGATLLSWTGQGGSPWNVVVTAALAYVGLVAATSMVGFFNLLLVSQVQTRLFRGLQEAGYRHLLSLAMSYFVRERTGELGTRLNSETFKAAHTMEPVIRGFIQAGAQLALSMLLLVRTNARLTAGVLVAFLIHLTITRVLRDRIRGLVADQLNLFSELAGRIHETVLSIRVVKSFGAEGFEIARFVDRARDLGRVMLWEGVYRYIEFPLRDIADAGGLVVVLLMAFAAFADGRLSASGFVLFVALTKRALTPASQLAESVLLLQAALGSADRILNLLDEKPQVADGPREAAPLREGIRLEHVHFAHQGHAPVLHDVSLEIRRGEMVALVGLTPMAAIITSFSTVPVGLLMVRARTPDAAPAWAAARSATPVTLLKASSLRPWIHKSRALGVWPRPWGTA